MKNNLVLADTTVWIHFLRGNSEAVRSRLVPLLAADRLATADIIMMEVLRGARSQKDYDALQKDLAALHCLEIGKKVWERASRIGFLLRGKGISVPLADTLIAAVAMEYDCLLLHDDRHYEMIAGVTKVKTERLAAG